ncbi:MAG TPA: glycosyltransferase family 2 protein [Leeuwenhoekiella sp.]|nr:glycosyltransferase family 2 protein [Leeuwenhoekiella sp.]
MILLVHHRGKRVQRVYSNGDQISCINHIPALALLELAENYPEELIVWCEERFEEGVNELKWQNILQNRLFLVSYSCSGRVFLPEAIGLIDTSVFTKINRDVRYPTWLMSGDRGGIYAKTLLVFKGIEIGVDHFDYFLSSIAKRGMPQGLLAYSDPKLADASQPNVIKYSSDNALLYDFVKAHYKNRWLVLLFFQQLIYQKKVAVLDLITAIFKPKKPYFQSFSLTIPTHCDSFSNKNSNTLDVLIPTTGRGKYLYDVLTDLREQTVLPKKVIIIEQNPEQDSTTQLDYLTAEKWPFEIDHTFIHKTGACNARNIGLEKVTAEWVFFADDDIRIPVNFIANTDDFIAASESDAFTVSCLRKGEPEPLKLIVQWRAFGSGCSFVKVSCLEDVRFDLAFEGGFGEDADFGMQLRNKGFDILYNPFLKLTHLKAPVGGFRHKVKQVWDDEEFLPKPAPTVMVYQLKHTTQLQRCGFKTILFLKFFRRQANKNPFSYFRNMQKRWEASKKWAKTLIDQNR